MNSEKRFLLMKLLLHCTVDQEIKKLSSCGSKIASILNCELENETKQENNNHLEFGSISKKSVIIKWTLNKMFTMKKSRSSLVSMQKNV